MRKQYLLIALLFIFSVSCFNHAIAQKGKPSKLDMVLVSDDDLNGNFQKFSFLSNGENVVYMLYSGYPNRIYAIDYKSGKYLSKTLRNDLFDVDGVYPHSYLSLGDDLYCFYEKFDKQADKMMLYVTVLSPDGTMKTIKDKEILSVDSKKRGRVSFEVILVENQNFVVNSKVVVDKNDEEVLTVFMFDKAFKEIGKASFNNKEIFAKKDGKMLDTKHGFIDDLFLVTIFNEKSGKTGKNISTLYAVDKTGKPSVTQELNTENVSLFDFKLIKNKAHLRLYAYYSDDKSEGIDGTIVFEFDKTKKKFITLNSSKFSKELKKTFISKRRARKDKGIGRFEFSDFLVLPDGGLNVVSEQVVRSQVKVRTGLVDVYVDVFYTTENQLVERYDSVGKLITAFPFETPVIFKGMYNYRVFNLAFIKNKPYLYFTALPKSFARSLRSNIVDYQRTKEAAIYTYDLTSDSKNVKLTQYSPFLEKRFVPGVFFPISGTTKFAVVCAKLKPRFFVDFARMVGINPKVKIGIIDLQVK